MEQNRAKIEELEEELEREDERIQHPMHFRLEQLEKDIAYLEQVIKDERFTQYALEDVCALHVKDAYRKKIKGFHLAFNVKEKLEESAKSKYQYLVAGSAEELRLAALDRKNQRLYRK